MNLDKKTYQGWIPAAAAAAAGYFGLGRRGRASGTTRRSGRQVRRPLKTTPSTKKPKSYVYGATNKRLDQMSRNLALLKRNANRQLGLLKFRKRETESIGCAQNGAGTNMMVGISTSAVEEPLTQLRVFNPSSPGTYITVNFTTGTQQKEVEIASVYTRFTARNNYNVPAYVSIYLCIPKVDTSIGALDAINNGLTDVSDGTLSTTNPQLKPWDSPQFRDLWQVKKRESKFLQPGQQLMLQHKVDSFMYDPSFVDTHGLLYQQSLGGHVYIVTIQGSVAHDSSTISIQGFSQAKVDIFLERDINVRYEAGADIEYVIVDDQAASFGANAVVGFPNNATGEVFSITL